MHRRLRKMKEKLTLRNVIIWGAAFDDKLEDEMKITVIATGFDIGTNPATGKSDEEKSADDQKDDENIDIFGEIIRKINADK